MANLSLVLGNEHALLPEKGLVEDKFNWVVEVK